jgi:hypothetical protein
MAGTYGGAGAVRRYANRTETGLSLWSGCLWADSAATLHNLKDRQSHAEHLVQNRIAYRIMLSRFVY